eukprot:TRINITY_DN5514_c0_g1_i3.p1 TRINITY_DN5514_c0_g1~~TRINITY_DN5514_c0_g1_i3.p1  ORF type:complete len:925 (-),score=267.12 TRINITY_DN5514_c0_g1_i3:120-2894(-)
MHTHGAGLSKHGEFLKIVGRLKELIVPASGKKVSPVYVEKKYCVDGGNLFNGGLPLFEAFHVYGRRRTPGSDDDKVELVSACIVPNKEHPLLTGLTLRAQCKIVSAAVDRQTDLVNNTDAIYHLDRYDVVSGPLPMTSSKKVKRNTLSAYVDAQPPMTDSTDSADSTEQAGAAAPDAAPGAVHEGSPWGTPSEAAVERVLKCVAIVKGEAGAQGSDEWHSLGLDSMAAVQLFSQIAIEFHAPLSYAKFLRYQTGHPEKSVHLIADLAMFVTEVNASIIVLADDGVQLGRLEEPILVLPTGESVFKATGQQKLIHENELDCTGGPAAVQSYILCNVFKLTHSDPNVGWSDWMQASTRAGMQIAIKQAIDVLARRHELLRTRFVLAREAAWEGFESSSAGLQGSDLLAVVQPPGMLDWNELLGWTQDVQYGSAQHDVAAVGRSYDFSTDSLIRVHVYEHPTDENGSLTMALSMHHIIYDALSVFFLLDEFAQLLSLLTASIPARITQRYLPSELAATPGRASDDGIVDEILSHLPKQPARFHHLMCYEASLVRDAHCMLDLQPAPDARHDPPGPLEMSRRIRNESVLQAQNHLKYWRSVLRPVVARRNKFLGSGSHPTGECPLVLDPALSRAVKQYCAEGGTSVFSLLLAGFAAQVHSLEYAAREGGEGHKEHVLVNSAVATRNQAEFRALFGPLISELGIMIEATGLDLTTLQGKRDLVDRCSDSVTQTLSHTDFPFADALEDSGFSLRPVHPSNNDGLTQFLFKYMFTYYSFGNTTIPQYDMSKLIAALSSSDTPPADVGAGMQFQRVTNPAGAELNKPSGGTHLYLFCQDAKDKDGNEVIEGRLRYHIPEDKPSAQAAATRLLESMRSFLIEVCGAQSSSEHLEAGTPAGLKTNADLVHILQRMNTAGSDEGAATLDLEAGQI